MFSFFVFDSHDHLISNFNPSEHCLDANHTYLIKSSFNFLIASCSWWYPIPLFALSLPSNSSLQIVLNLVHILQPFKTWSPWVTSQMRRKTFAFMSFQICNTSVSVSSSGLLSSLKLLCDCCRCWVTICAQSTKSAPGTCFTRTPGQLLSETPFVSTCRAAELDSLCSTSPSGSHTQLCSGCAPLMGCELSSGNKELWKGCSELMAGRWDLCQASSNLMLGSISKMQGRCNLDQQQGLGGTNTRKHSLSHSKEDASKNGLLWACHGLNSQKGSLTKFLDQNRHWGCLLQFLKC